MSSNINLRKAKREDMAGVVSLIRELAVFEQMEDQVHINEDKLIKDGFEQNPPYFGCFVAEDIDSGNVIGYAIYYECYSTWVGKSISLEDLYVQEKYRNQGVGRKLLLSVAEIGYNTGRSLDFHVLLTNPAINFYYKLGAINASETENWQLFRLDKNKLGNILNTFDTL